MFELKEIFYNELDVSGPLIYRIVNLEDNKSYIGQTKISLRNRFVTSRFSHLNRYISEDYPSKLYSDMRELGIEKFGVEILYKGEDLDSQEKLFISKFDSELNGYSLTIGGKSFSKQAQINGAKKLSEKCKYSNKGSFFNVEEHRKAASKGGKIVRVIQVKRVLNELNARNLEINEENYSAIRAEISNRTCPNYNSYLNKYIYLI